jgi:hypothetical protein
MNNSTETKPLTTVQIYKKRVADCKPFPEKIRRTIRQKYPEYDNEIGRAKIHNVLSGSASDIRLTEIIETLCKMQKP